MPNNLEQIIKDLYELDPTLRSEDKAVRGLVSSLLANKPVVLPDQAFVKSLRAKLLVVDLEQEVNDKPILSPWFRYFVPIGVVATLVFMLLPKPLTHQALPTQSVEESAISPMVDIQAKSIDENSDASRPAKAPKASSAAGETRAMESLALPATQLEPELKMSAPKPEWDSFGIQNQLPGRSVVMDFTSFRAPAQVAIYRVLPNGELEPLGLSKEVPAGFNEHIEIYLNKNVNIGETLVAEALYVNVKAQNDRRFELLPDNGDNLTVYGRDGQVLRQVFYIVPALTKSQN